MANLRIVEVNIIDSTTISVSFTATLNPNIDTDNASIISQTANVPSSTVLKLEVLGASLTITCQPLTPEAAYFISFKSTPEAIFKSLNGDAVLLEDGQANQQLIIGPAAPDNIVQEFLINYINPRDNIYNVSDTTTLVNKFVQALTSICSRALYDIHQLKNENYLSFIVNDEQHVRSSGPFDRLSEEAAYEILRVGLTPTGLGSNLTLNISDFTDSNVTLQATLTTDFLTESSNNKIGTFNINDFTLNVLHTNVIILKSLIFTYSTPRVPYVYNIEILGYQILDSRYDKEFGSTYLLLNNNQFKINSAILNDPNFSTEDIFQIQVEYQYKDLGRVIAQSTVEVTATMMSIRELVPPIVNVFNLQHAPITTSTGKAGSIGNVDFINPNGITITSPHPAFLYELPFSFGSPPSNPGEYSVNYSDGTVYVYGADAYNDGTGPFPPLATYFYEFIYKPSVDYTYDPDTNDLVALPDGNLINNAGSITFNYEKVLVPGVDYNVDLHIESLNERIQNRLLSLNILSTENAPITNVFRIYNETSGEIYNTIRWNNNKVYFSYVNPPNVLAITAERASFNTILNELLFINQILINTSSINIFQCFLQNDIIIAGTEDCIGSSINSSAKFSNTDIFTQEIWYDPNETVILNINRIITASQYMIDYSNGIVYIGVIDPTNISIGTISYKNDIIVPQFPHLISVDDIYYQINFLNPKNKHFAYNRFFDGGIVPSSFDISDEGFLDGYLGEPYQVHNGKVGAFIDATFEAIVSNDIKFVRSLYEFDDLKFNTNPLNFASFTSSNARTIIVNPATFQQLTTVQFDGTNHYVLTNLNLPYISPNFTFNVSVERLSDHMQLWDGSGVITAGNPLKFVLSGVNSPVTGDSVLVQYSITINDLSRVIVDYNKGEYYIDYTYLADEILVSYEYGDNVLDFRQSMTVPAGTTYYASYKVGALRDALLKNFGTLINIPELATFDTDFERERYRDALSAALSSFIQGPTVSAMKSLVEQISHIEPELIESAFQNWSLGSSLLNPTNIETTGSFTLVPSKYDNGAVINTPGQTITMPVSSNLRLENGSFECWVMPEWDGLDNDANLTISVLKDGYIIPSDHIFIGAAEYHPIYSSGQFIVNKQTNVIGTPNMNKDGVFIYYDKDIGGDFNRWYFEVIDGYSDGYFDGYGTSYKVQITSDGLFYDLKSLSFPQPSNLSITSGTNKVSFTITNGVPFDEGITFLSDHEHYILDFGEHKTKNRFSIFKDPSGYFNFKVYDRAHRAYVVSANVSNWKANELHHISTSWSLNTSNNKDEMHLFIDGLEVPNIIRYGNKVQPYLHEKFRTVNPEELAGVVTKNIVASTDLVTIAGNTNVSSSLNFNAYGIQNGATIFIDEIGFNPAGYIVLTVSGNILTLSSPMPISLINGRFSINRISLTVITEIDIYPNITVSTISSILDGYDIVATDGYDTITSSSTNFTTAGILPGNLVRIDGYSQLLPNYTILNVSGHTLTINDTIPINITNSVFHIYANDPVEMPGVRSLHPSYSISVDGYFNNILTLSNNVKANDLILIETLGINHKRTRQKYYQWGNNSNIITTRLPPPISLNQVSVNHILLAPTIINSSNSVVIVNAFTSNQLSTDQPSVSNNGRTLAVSITTNNNINFTTPVSININGKVGVSTITETLIFNSIGTQNTLNKFSQVNYIQASGLVFNPSKNFLVLTLQEAFPITTPENSTVSPVIRFSYQVLAGSGTLNGSGTTVTDPTSSFSALDIGSYLIIISTTPFVAGVVGTYQILDVSADHHSATIDTSLSSFSGGTYQVLNTTTFRSGFQNGFFVFEDGYLPGTPYNLTQGLYELDYFTYLSIKFDPLDVKAFLGSDFNGDNLLNGTIDEVKIIANKLTDTRIGETALATQETITKDFHSLKALKADKNTIMLCHFDFFPFINDADFYIRSNKNYIQSGLSVNDNFDQSVVITNTPIVVDNAGIINKQEGTIEFWVSPKYDTQNDPNYRFYFDATSTQIERVVSINDVSVVVSGRVGQVISVQLQDGNPSIDYFAGGKVETSTQGAIQETAISTSSNTVSTSKSILQVITVKVIDDPTNTDYFAGGVIGTDKKTIFLAKTLPENNLDLVITYKPASGGDQTLNSQVIHLNRQLPNQNTPVVVTYMPNGTQGDRISIYTDPSGYINFDIRASGIDYVVRAPALWASNTWHRVKAMYSINGGQNSDTIRLFIDGYERGNILFGTGLLFGDPHVFGSTFVGSSTIRTNIVFNDMVNELFIGSDYTKSNIAYASFDNLRISNIARPLYAPFGESIDVNYNSNLDIVFPVTPDLYTTLLLDFDTLITKNTNFATLKNKNGGNFDFTLNIFDSFDIISSSAIVQNTLETLINVLKPATSRVFINYIE